MASSSRTFLIDMLPRLFAANSAINSSCTAGDWKADSTREAARSGKKGKFAPNRKPNPMGSGLST